MKMLSACTIKIIIIAFLILSAFSQCTPIDREARMTYNPPMGLKWGMTLEEVNNILGMDLCRNYNDSSSYLLKYETCNGESVFYSVIDTSSEYHMCHELSIELGEEEGLVELSAIFKEPGHDFIEILIKELKLKYGDPFSEYEKDDVRIYKFLAIRNKTNVVIFASPSLTIISHSGPDYNKLSNRKKKNR